MQTMDRMPAPSNTRRRGAVAVALVLFVGGWGCLAGLVTGADLVQQVLPGGLPVGNAVAAAALLCFAGAAVQLSTAPGWVAWTARVSLGMAVAWLPLSALLAGNLQLNFHGDAGTLWAWLTALTLGLALVSFACAGIQRVHRRMRRR